MHVLPDGRLDLARVPTSGGGVTPTTGPHGLAPDGRLAGTDPTAAAPDDFDAFVVARYASLVSLARYVSRDRHRAEDVVQEVLGRAFARWPKIARLDAPDAYVRRMVVRECLSWRRRRSSGEVPSAPEALPSGAVDDGSSPQADRDAMLRRLAMLSDRQRAVLVLRHYEDLSDHQIADVLDIREATVRGHAMAGLERLRALVAAEDDGAGPADGDRRRSVRP